MKKLLLTVTLMLGAMEGSKEQPLGIIQSLIKVRHFVTCEEEPLHEQKTPYDLDKLKKVLGEKESNNNYLAVNTLGYMGKYQFSQKTLNTLKIRVNRKQFLSDSCLQEKAFEKLVRHHYEFLKRNNLLNKVGTKSIDGFPITLEGLLAACHLVGPVSVYDYVINKNRHNRIITWGGVRCKVYKVDAYGTKMQKYFQL